MAVTSLAVLSILLLQQSTADTNDTNCSAIESYVEVISSGDFNMTLTSAHALFPPYSYYLEYTDLIQLTSSDDPCSVSGVSTDVTDKVVLMFESVGNCSSHYKVYVAEENGALGVLLANNDISGEVITIIDDDSITTNIPTRSISLSAGNALSDELDDLEVVEVEFGCFDSDYPTHLCMLDTMGDAWFLDGDYQRQEDTYNDHPIYKKEGYVWIVDDVYVFLHDAYGDDDWFWAITSDPSLSNDDWIQAECVDLDISDPSMCTTWNLTETDFNPDSRDDDEGFEYYPYLNVSEGLCTVSDNTLCMESSQSNLMGMGGTYHQFNDATPYWFREASECDSRPGWLLFHDGYFMVWDTFDDVDVAVCKLQREYYTNRSSWDMIKFRPDLCDHWKTVDNAAIGGSDELYEDETFSIFMNGSCTETCGSGTEAPDDICFSHSSGAYSFMEGDYTKTDNVGDIYGYPEYERSDAIYHDGEEVLVYMWYYGDVSTDTELQWWVLSSSSLENATAQNGSVPVYGFCEATVGNPADCTAGWRFYFANMFQLDDSFTMSAGECEEVTTMEAPSYPEYLCIESGSTRDSYVPADYYTGGYYINETGTAQSGDVPHWMKPKNDNWKRHDVYLYLDGFYGWWQIGNAMHTFDYVNLICFDSDGPSPLDCNMWYDYRLNQLPNMNVYECTEEEVEALNPETMEDGSNGEDGMNDSNKSGHTTTGIIIGIIMFVLLCVGVFLWWIKSRRDEDLKKWNKKGQKMESEEVEDGPAGTGTQIEMDQPFSQQDHRKVSGHVAAKSHTGAFDMSPLNVNGPTSEDHLDPTIDHDDEDYASDGNHATGDVLE